MPTTPNNISILKDVMQLTLFRTTPGSEKALIKNLKKEFELWHSPSVAERIFLGGVFGIYDLCVLNLDRFLFPHMSLRLNLKTELSKHILSRTNFSCYTYSHLHKNDNSIIDFSKEITEQLKRSPYSFSLCKINPKYFKNKHFVEKKLFRKLKSSSEQYSTTWVWGTYGWHEILMLHVGKDFSTHTLRAKNLQSWRFDPATGDVYSLKDLQEFHNNKEKSFSDLIKTSLPLVHDSIIIPGLYNLYTEEDSPKTPTPHYDNVSQLPCRISDAQVTIQTLPGRQEVARMQLNEKKALCNEILDFKFGIDNNITCNFKLDTEKNKSIHDFISFYRWVRCSSWTLSTKTSLLSEANEDPICSILANSQNNTFENNDPLYIDNSQIVKLIIKKASRYNKKIFPSLKLFFEENESKFNKDDIEKLSAGDTFPLFRLLHLINVLNGHLSEPTKAECVADICLMVKHFLKAIESEYQEDNLYAGKFINEFCGFIEDMLLEESVGGYYNFPATEVIGFADLSIGGTRRIRRAITAIPVELTIKAFKKINEKNVLKSITKWFAQMEAENTIGRCSDQDSSLKESLYLSIKRLPFIFRARHRDLFEYIYPYAFNIPMPSLFSSWQLYRLFHETGHFYWCTLLSDIMNTAKLQKYRSEIGVFDSPGEQRAAYTDEETFCDIFEYLIGYERDWDLFLNATIYRIYFLMGREEIKDLLVADFIPRTAVVWWIEMYLQGREPIEITEELIDELFLTPFKERFAVFISSKIQDSETAKANVKNNLFYENYEFINKHLTHKFFLLRDIEKRICNRLDMYGLFFDLLGGEDSFKGEVLEDFPETYKKITSLLDEGIVIEEAILKGKHDETDFTPSKIIRALLWQRLHLKEQKRKGQKNKGFFQQEYKRNIATHLSLLHWLNIMKLNN